MSDAPLVTVLINAYNGAEYLGEALDSVYRQTLQDFEVILYDDASTDATPEIAKRYDGRLRYYRAEKQVPLGEARNRALELSRGRYVSFLDQDDLFLPRKLERQAAAFRGDVALVFSNSIRFWEKTGKEDLLYKTRPPDGRVFRDLMRWYYLSINTVTILRDALPKDPAWWFPASFRMCEETDLFLRLAHEHPIAYVDEPLAKYRVHERNFSITHRELVISEHEEMLGRFIRIIPDFERQYASEIAGVRAEIKRTQAQIHWKNGLRRSAWTSYLEGLRLHPRGVFVAELLMSTVLPFEALSAVRDWIRRPI